MSSSKHKPYHELKVEPQIKLNLSRDSDVNIKRQSNADLDSNIQLDMMCSS